jgi:Uma2 family endonuclease
MGMPAATTRWTAEMVRALPDDGNRYEVVDGALLVTPAPTWDHQRAIRALFLRLHPYLTAHRIGQAIWAPADVTFSETRMVEPDLFVVPLLNGREPRTWEDVRRLLLAVEILSPSTARADRQVKRRLYQREGVPDYWIVDVNARLVERWRPEDDRPEIVSERLTWQPESAHPPLEIDLSVYFAEVWGE